VMALVGSGAGNGHHYTYSDERPPLARSTQRRLDSSAGPISCSTTDLSYRRAQQLEAMEGNK
jgi:hypothetical protein